MTNSESVSKRTNPRHIIARSVATRQSGTGMNLDCFLLRTSQSAMTKGERGMRHQLTRFPPPS
ncbi:MAG: hypothetical protein LBG28_00925 [Tannerella sp.]|nr:hypothetical protein [Tannerella sp.]